MDGLLHIGKRRIQWYVSLNGGQFIRKVGQVLIGRQLFASGSFDFIHVGIEVIQILVFREKAQSGLFPYAGDSWDIIGRIPHEGLHINDLGRGDMVFLVNCFRRHSSHIGDALLGKKHRGAAAGKLECIPVAGDDIYRKFLFVSGREGAKDIIAFVAGNAVNGNTHDPEHVKNQVKLGHQFRRCRLPCSFVSIVHLRTECMAVFIEGDGHVFRIQIPVQAQKHPEESVYRIGRNSIGRCHSRRQGKKSAIQKAAAINNYKFLFHSSSLPTGPDTARAVKNAVRCFLLYHR